MGLDTVELVMAVEEEFGVAIANAEAATIRTVGDLYWVVQGKLERGESTSAAARALTPPELWERVASIVAHEAGVELGRVTPGARFLDDLGMD